MNRREALSLLAALPWLATAGSSSTAAAETKRTRMGLVIHSYWVRRDKPLLPEYGSISDPLDFLELAHKLGAAGVQTRIPASDDASLEKLHERTAAWKMHLEGIVSLPKSEADVARFENEIVAAKRAGVSILRTVCLSGRRYETFDSREAFDQFAKQSWTSLSLAEPIVARHGIQLAVENHKDWRVDEMIGWLKRLDSRHVGVCLDTGNSIALLEDPHAVAEALAPWTITTHLKDMAVVESDDGFLLSEVPFGDGFLDLKRIIAALQKARPDVRLNLEMITRDPLRVPCLTEKYWATFEKLPARELAAALTRIRRHRTSQPLPTVKQLSHPEQLLAEAKNIDRCLNHARESLGL